MLPRPPGPRTRTRPAGADPPSLRLPPGPPPTAADGARRLSFGAAPRRRRRRRSSSSSFIPPCSAPFLFLPLNGRVMYGLTRSSLRSGPVEPVTCVTRGATGQQSSNLFKCKDPSLDPTGHWQSTDPRCGLLGMRFSLSLSHGCSPPPPDPGPRVSGRLVYSRRSGERGPAH